MTEYRSESSDPYRTVSLPEGSLVTEGYLESETGGASHSSAIRLVDALRAGGYEVLGELGRGGMGVVYLARNKSLNRLCALKTFSAGWGGATAAARLRTEAETIAQLQHPNVVQIFGAGE